MREDEPLSVVTIPIQASQLRAGMTLFMDGRKVLIEAVGFNSATVLLTANSRNFAVPKQEEVEVRASGKRPHYTLLGPRY